MKLKLSKKTKTFLWVATALATSTAATALLTSCSTANQTIIDDTGGWDKQYGINEATYVRMEKDFKVLYKSQLDDKKRDGKIDDATYNLQLTTFQNKLNSLHTSLYSDENKTLSYTLRTEALQNFAQKNYNIFLKREYFNISIPNFYECLKSYLSFARSYFDEIKCDADLANFLYYKVKTYGDKFINELVLNLDKKDLIVEMRNFQENLVITAMSDINQKVAEYESSQQLKKFFETYSITSLKKVDDSYAWDSLNSDPFFNTKNADVSSYINHIFTISRKGEDGDIIFSRFRNDIIPGYILTPKMKEMRSDPEKNIYNVLIDWEISIADADTHEYYDDASLYSDLQYNKNLSVEYELPVSKTFEYNQLNNIYLNNIELHWDTPDKCAKEEFFTPNNSTTVENDVKSLARAGLIVNNTRLSALIDADPTHVSNADTSLEQKFINNCTLYAKSEIFYDDSNLIESNFYVGFSHSFSAMDINELREEHTFKFQNIKISNMEVSNEFYENAVQSYNSVLKREIHAYATTLLSKNISLDSGIKIEYTMLGVIALMTAVSILCFVLFAKSLGFAFEEIISATLLVVQIALLYVTLGAISYIIGLINVQIDKYEEFANQSGIKIEATTDYPEIIPNSSTSATKKESKSTSAFIKRVEDDHFIFETKSEFSKTHEKITPNDKFLYYKDIASNPNNNDSKFPDYIQFLKTKKEFEVSEDYIIDAWCSNLQESTIDEKKGTVYVTKTSILDEIGNVLFMIQSLWDLVTIAALAVSPTATGAVAAEKVAVPTAYKMLLKFIFNIGIMQVLPYLIQGTIEKLVNWILF